MKEFNLAYRKNIGERYDKDKTYLFILGEDASRSDRDAQGFMPLGGRFGYLFKNQISANEITTIAAHELGHGIWALKHTFDNDYGNIAVNTTGNLMDYTPGATHLAKWQWEIIRYPALFTDPFGSDEEGEWVNLDVAENLILLRKCSLNYVSIKTTKKSGRLNSGYKFFEYTIKSNIFLIYEKESTFDNITFTKDVIYANAYNANMYQIKISNFGVINCLSEYDRDIIYDFLVNKKDNTTLFGNESLIISDKTYTLQNIYTDVERMRATIDKSGKQITETDKLILNIPVIQWRLGWHYGSVFYYNWLVAGGDITADDNLKNWLQSWDVYKQRIDQYENYVNDNILNNPIKQTQTKEYEAINSTLDLFVENPQTNIYAMKDLLSLLDNNPNISQIKWDENRNITNFSITTIAANEDSETFSGWLAALGSVSIQHCFGGTVVENNESNAIIDISETNIYIRDGFDFSGKDQPLGKWENNIISPKKPTISAAEYMINKAINISNYITNEKMNNFRIKYGIGQDFNIYIDFSAKQLFNIILINKINHEITYQK
jgi:hypothetical protein